MICVKGFTPHQRATFERICQLSQTGVLSMMRQFLVRKYGQDNVIATNSYIVAEGDLPVALIAHADTVFRTPPEEFFYDADKCVMWSPDGMGADDRAGIYAIVQIVSAGFLPHIIITTDEESGCIGATKLVKKYNEYPFDELKFMIELDRRGTDDSVYYECGNTKFQKFIDGFGFTLNYGTLSDISVLGPFWDVAAVNFSIGYVDEHSKSEHLYVNAFWRTVNRVKKILEYVKDHRLEIPEYEYKEVTYGYGRGYHYGYYNYDDNYTGWSWNDDGYSLTPTAKNSPLMKGYAQCGVCGDVDHQYNLLEIFYDTNKAMDMCNDCYSRAYELIEWCSECKAGWYLTEEERAWIETNGRNNWKCRNCGGVHGIERSVGESKQSDSALAGLGASGLEHSANQGGVAKCEKQIHDIHEWSGL